MLKVTKKIKKRLASIKNDLWVFWENLLETDGQAMHFQKFFWSGQRMKRLKLIRKGLQIVLDIKTILFQEIRGKYHSNSMIVSQLIRIQLLLG